MKKRLFTVLVTLIVLSAFSLQTFATSDTPSITPDSGDDVVLYYDSFYITITFSVTPSDVQPAASGDMHTVNATAQATGRDEESGDVLWIYELHGNFTYQEGVYCICNSSYHTCTIVDRKWSFTDYGTSESGNTCRGQGLLKKRVLLVVVSTADVDMLLRMSPMGAIY